MKIEVVKFEGLYARIPKEIICVCGKVFSDQHRPIAAYGSWCCPDRLYKEIK